jgi:HAD superfamily hydrolase (TIGR01509 family)
VLSNIDTVLFDLDGTLTVPVIDFDGLRKSLGLPDGVSIAHALNELPEPDRERGFEIVRAAEIEAAHNAVANHGAIDLVRWLHGHQIATGIITRNFQAAVDITLDALGLAFDVVITRDCSPPKPAPDAVHEALRRLGRKPQGTLMVGDYRDDIEAGKAAGALTCLVNNGEGKPRFEADIVVPWLSELLVMFKQAK